jgi:hypothetical protein
MFNQMKIIYLHNKKGATKKINQPQLSDYNLTLDN